MSLLEKSKFDFPGCLTQGEDMEETYNMAVDALGLALEDRICEHNVPEPSMIDSLEYGSNTYPVIIEFNLDLYRKRTNSKAVKKGAFYSSLAERGSDSPRY